MTEDLNRLDAMRASGELSDAEYADALRNLAGRNQQPSPPPPPPPAYFPAAPPMLQPIYMQAPRKRHPFRWIFSAAVIVIVIIAIVSVHAANTGGVNTKATGGSKGATAHLGDSITVTGDEGLKVVVTLVAVSTTARFTDGISTVDPGDALYAAQFRIADTGTAAFDDAVDNDAVVIDATGQQFEPDIAEGISAGAQFPDIVKIAPGSSALGWVPFEVKAGSTITGAQFSLSSGFGNSAQWIIP